MDEGNAVLAALWRAVRRDDKEARALLCMFEPWAARGESA